MTLEIGTVLTLVALLALVALQLYQRRQIKQLFTSWQQEFADFHMRTVESGADPEWLAEHIRLMRKLDGVAGTDYADRLPDPYGDGQ